MKDSPNELSGFVKVFDAIVTFVHNQSISLSDTTSFKNKDIVNDFYNQNLIYKLSFPHQLGVSDHIVDFDTTCHLVVCYSKMNKDVFEKDFLDVLIGIHLGEQIFVLEGFTPDECKEITDKIILKSVETDFYSPIIIIE
jgi:hypothetical protein